MLRPPLKTDLPYIIEIEKASFSEPWSEKTIAGALFGDTGGAVKALVQGGEKPVGFVIFSLIDGEAEIYDIAVAPESRRKGVGRELIEGALKIAERAFLEVREGNIPAKELYKAAGFKEYGIRKGYYSDGENAVVMVYERT